MIKRDLQEVADFFGCKVKVNPSTNNVVLWDTNGYVNECMGYLNHQIVLKSNMADGKLTYEPQEKQEKSENKNSPCYQDFTDSNNKKDPIEVFKAIQDRKNSATHQSEVHTHKEYKILSENLYFYEDGYDIDLLSRKITKLLNEGWMPYGNPIISAYNKDDWKVYQAMVRGV